MDDLVKPRPIDPPDAPIDPPLDEEGLSDKRFREYLRALAPCVMSGEISDEYTFDISQLSEEEIADYYAETYEDQIMDGELDYYDGGMSTERFREWALALAPRIKSGEISDGHMFNLFHFGAQVSANHEAEGYDVQIMDGALVIGVIDDARGGFDDRGERQE